MNSAVVFDVLHSLNDKLIGKCDDKVSDSTHEATSIYHFFVLRSYMCIHLGNIAVFIVGWCMWFRVVCTLRIVSSVEMLMKILQTHTFVILFVS